MAKVTKLNKYAKAKTVVAAKAGVKTKADLRGKRIAFTAGTGSEVYTATLLKSAGLTPSLVALGSVGSFGLVLRLSTRLSLA